MKMLSPNLISPSRQLLNTQSDLKLLLLLWHDLLNFLAAATPLTYFSFLGR